VYQEYGLNVVPRAARNFTWWRMSLIWGGISFCLPTFMIGALPVPGLTWSEALWVNLAGNAVCAILIALAGSAGVKRGLPAAALWTEYFGAVLGNYLLPLALFFSTCGWFGIMLAATADGLTEILRLTDPCQTLLLLLLLGAAMTATAVGNRYILYLSRVSVPLLLLLIVFYFFHAVTPAAWARTIAYTPTGASDILVVFNLIVSGYLVGAICAPDFSRYARNNTANWVGSVLGAGLISLLLSIIGMYVKAVTGDWNPLKAVHFYGSSLVSLVILVFSAWTTNHALLYSAGLSLTKLFGARRPARYIVGAGIVGTVFAATGVTANLEFFLSLLSYVFPALLGLFLSHHFLAARFYAASRPSSFWPVWSTALLSGIISSVCAPEWASSLAGLTVSGVAYVLSQWLFRALVSPND
jgi:cytosine permease